MKHSPFLDSSIRPTKSVVGGDPCDPDDADFDLVTCEYYVGGTSEQEEEAAKICVQNGWIWEADGTCTPIGEIVKPVDTSTADPKLQACFTECDAKGLVCDPIKFVCVPKGTLPKGATPVPPPSPKEKAEIASYGRKSDTSNYWLYAVAVAGVAAVGAAIWYKKKGKDKK